MKIGDLVKSTGYGPEGTTGELGFILKPDSRFPNTWIVRWNNGLVYSYAQQGLVIVSAC